MPIATWPAEMLLGNPRDGNPRYICDCDGERSTTKIIANESRRLPIYVSAVVRTYDDDEFVMGRDLHEGSGSHVGHYVSRR